MSWYKNEFFCWCLMREGTPIRATSLYWTTWVKFHFSITLTAGATHGEDPCRGTWRKLTGETGCVCVCVSVCETIPALAGQMWMFLHLLRLLQCTEIWWKRAGGRSHPWCQLSPSPCLLGHTDLHRFNCALTRVRDSSLAFSFISRHTAEMWLMCRLTEINEKLKRFANDHKDLSLYNNDLILMESCRKRQCKQLNERRAVIKRRDPGDLVMKQHADVF